MRFNDTLNQVNSEGRGGRQGARAGVNACAVGWMSRVYVALELLVRRSFCFVRDSFKCFRVCFPARTNKQRASMADPVQLPDDTPERDDTRNNSAGGGDGGADGGATPPRDPADPLSEAHLKSLAEHVARFLAGSHSSGSSSASGKWHVTRASLS